MIGLIVVASLAAAVLLFLSATLFRAAAIHLFVPSTEWFE